MTSCSAGHRPWNASFLEGPLLEGANVLCLITLAPRNNVELDGLALLEVLEAVTGDSGVVHEDICAALAGDEAVALLGIEKLDSACGHSSSSFDVTGGTGVTCNSRRYPVLAPTTCIQGNLDGLAGS